MDKFTRELIADAIRRELPSAYIILSPEVVHSSSLDVPTVQLVFSICKDALSSLVLFNLDVDDATAEFLVGALATSRNVTRIHFDAVRLSTRALTHMMRSIKALHKVSDLEVKAIALDATSAQALMESIAALTQLTRLTLVACFQADSHELDIGVALDSLPKLSVLTIRDCRLSPSGLSIEYINRNALALDLAGNFLTDESCFALCSDGAPWQNLRHLSLATNCIGSLGATRLFRRSELFPCLRMLSLSHNAIDDAVIPSLYDALRSAPWRTTLEELDVSQTRISSVPSDVIASSIASHLRLHSVLECNDPTTLLPFASVMILGNSGVGKTHISHRLRRLRTHDMLYFNASESRTHGWSRQTMEVDVVVRETRLAFQASIWDLGGERELLAAQRLLLRGLRHVFVVACDATQTNHENGLERWLRIIMAEGQRGSPVIVVMTKGDLRDDSGRYNEPRMMQAPSEEELRRDGLLWPESLCVVVDSLGWSEGGSETENSRLNMVAEHADACGRLRAHLSVAIAHAPGCSDAHGLAALRGLLWIERNFGPLRNSDWSHVPYRDVVAAIMSLGLTSEGANGVIKIAADLGWCFHGAGRVDIRRGEALAETIVSLEWLRTPVCRLVQLGRDLSTRGILTWEQVEALLPLHASQHDHQDIWYRMAFSEEERVLIADIMCAQEIMFRVEQRGAVPKYFCPQHLAYRGLHHAPDGRFVWVRPTCSSSVFERVVGRLHVQALADPAALWRDEITLRIGKRKSLVVRRSDAAIKDARGVEGAVFAAAIGMSFGEAERLIDMLDAEFRAALGAPALGPSAWKLVAGLAPSAEPDDSKVPEYAVYAVRVYQAVHRAHLGRGLQVSRWEELVQAAQQLAAVAGTELGDSPDFRADVRLALADVERFARYCRMAGLSAWWSTRGKRRRGGVVGKQSERDPDPADG
jgi:hypothetical protein